MQKALYCCKVWLLYGNRQSAGVQKFLVLFLLLEIGSGNRFFVLQSSGGPYN